MTEAEILSLLELGLRLTTLGMAEFQKARAIWSADSLDAAKKLLADSGVAIDAARVEIDADAA